VEYECMEELEMGHIEKIGSMELLKRHRWITLELKFHKDWISDLSELVQVFNIPLKLNPFPKTQKKRSSIYKISQSTKNNNKIDNLCFNWEQIGFPSNMNLTRKENRNTKISITLHFAMGISFLVTMAFCQ
jgi:hypothetical protein